MLTRVSHYRWIIVGVLFLFSLVNSVDRLALSLLGPTLQLKLGFTSVEYSYVVTAFLVAYTAGYSFAGPVLDRVGVRRGLAYALGFWSAAAALHSLMAGWVGLAVARLLLGFGESFNSPGGIKALSEWMPARERGLATAIFSNGNVIGAALAPPLVAGLAMYVGWRWTFVATAGLGLLLLAVWRKVYFPPEEHPQLTEPERALILAGRDVGAVQSETGDARGGGARSPSALGLTDCGPERGTARPEVALHHRRSPWQLFTHPLCLCFFAVRFLTDPVAYFFNFWLPDYFGHGRGFTLAMVGMVAWIPYLAGDIGGLGGGAWSDWLIRRGWAPRQARLRVMGTAACLMPVALLAVSTPSVTWAVALIGLLFIGQTAWMANQLSLISECFPRSVAATALSISAMGGSLGGVVATLATGRVVKAYGYGPVFAVMSGLHLTAFVILIVGLRRAQRSVRSGFGP